MMMLLFLMLSPALSFDRYIILDTNKTAFLEVPAVPKSIELSLNIPSINWTINDQPCFQNGTMAKFSEDSTRQLFEIITSWIKTSFPDKPSSKRSKRFIGDPFRIKPWGLNTKRSSTKQVFKSLNNKSTINSKTIQMLAEAVNRDILEINSEFANQEQAVRDFMQGSCKVEKALSESFINFIIKSIVADLKATIQGIQFNMDLFEIFAILCAKMHEEIYDNCAEILTKYPPSIDKISANSTESHIVLNIKMTANIPTFKKIGKTYHILESPLPIKSDNNNFIYEKLILPRTIATDNQTSSSIDLCRELANTFICTFGELNMFRKNLCAHDLLMKKTTNCETELIRTDKACLFNKFGNFLLISHFNTVGISFFNKISKTE